MTGWSRSRWGRLQNTTR